MDIALALKRQRPLKGLIGVEKLALAYAVFTAVTLLAVVGGVEDIGPFVNRALIIGCTLCLWRLYVWMPCDCTYVIRVLFQVGLLAYWYPDIYCVARYMPSMDHLLAGIDETLFGCQPSLLLKTWLPGLFWSEMFNMGYFSYYLMIIAVVGWALVANYRRFERTSTIVVCSFLIYYIFFMLFESAGPQFYFNFITVDQAMDGNFIPAGDYFCSNSVLVHDSEAPKGFFTALVHWAQQSERPIAAFPSSHVGLSTILLIFAAQLSRKLLRWMLPFYVLLCISTVYIGAHYVIDVFGGWVSAVIVYYISQAVYKHPLIHRPKEGENHRHRHAHHRHHHHHHSH